ncbi:SIMPL domain-containing protein [Flavobacterium sp.]|uniref:SIMPL domain-containing protein n=1 Tax=Flavobacterium sp. TaxID=239 RepID=UPI001B752978|nr:SIMPL domain-containing protein [Flavobacterium sp.]MBP6127769.1 SIMPL domain-containing protein [Flavobacterium sp.]
MNQLVILCLLFLSTFSFGQTTTQTPENTAYIDVTGTVEKEVIPDEIYIQIIIREKYVNKVKVSIEEQEVKLKNALKSIEIDLSNLFLSDVNANYVKVSWQKKDVLTKKDYTLKVSNATAVGKVFQELDKLEITEASISKVNHSKIDSLQQEVRILAIKAAKEKADYLLAAIGEQTGKPLIVTETPITLTRLDMARMPVRSANFVASSIEESDLKSYEIDFQKIKLSASIYVKFSIK